MSSPGSIFISYRRSDSIAETGRIYDRLVAEFGRDHVFKDVDSIPFEVDFAEYLDEAVNQCQVLLVIIGQSWLTVTEADGARRLDNPDDFVRIEVESALRRSIPVIPVLLEGASMPCRSQLPASLQRLARRNGTQVGDDPRFHADMTRLVQGIQDLLGVSEVASEPIAAALTEASATQPPGPSLPTFSFEVVKVNSQGKEIERHRKTAAYVREDLGNGISLDLAPIPGGSFQMGSPDNEPERSDEEGPQHEVQVQGFFMGRYLITKAQWKEVAGFPEVNRPLDPDPTNFIDPDPTNFKGETHPVEQVSWHDAVEFCARLSAHTQRDYRLPTEAEWEYACRAGTTTPFHCGEMLNTNVANYHALSYGGGDTTPVDQFKVANAFGLSDMHGNVREWCQDHWHDNYENAPTNGSAWLTQDDDAERVLRGGCWGDFPWHCRSAYRDSDLPIYCDPNHFGFRVVCSAP